VTEFDALIVGGGPAGLSAGLWLARYRRRVRILDSERPRNEPTWAVHGYPGLVDPGPHELRQALWQQAEAAGAERESCEVLAIDGEKNSFNIHLQGGAHYRARRVVLAYGRRDIIPTIEGLDKLYGISVFHCPDCDGPSMIDQRIGVLGSDRGAAILALYLLTWASSVTLLTNGAELDLKDAAHETLIKNAVSINTKSIARLCADGDRLSAVEFKDGDALPMDGFFFSIGSHPASDLAGQLGCKRDEDGNVIVDHSHETSTPGVYAAGDLAGGPYLAIIAAAEGVKTGMTVHKSLQPPEFEL
jgi:thioredoxin reductase